MGRFLPLAPLPAPPDQPQFHGVRTDAYPNPAFEKMSDDRERMQGRPDDAVALLLVIQSQEGVVRTYTDGSIVSPIDPDDVKDANEYVERPKHIKITL